MWVYFRTPQFDVVVDCPMPTFIKLVDPMPLEVTGMVVYDGTAMESAANDAEGADKTPETAAFEEVRVTAVDTLDPVTVCRRSGPLDAAK